MTDRSVLVVEDEALIALDIRYELEDRGWRVIGPAGTVDKARQAIDAARADDTMPAVALLDIDLGNGTSFALAESLLAEGVAVVFLSGDRGLTRPASLDGCELLSKPIDFERVQRVLEACLGG